MKYLGLIGADDFAAATTYSRRIVSEVRHRFGPGGEIRLAALNLNTPEISEALDKQQWSRASELLSAGTTQLLGLGVEAIVACSSRLQSAAEKLKLPVPNLPMANAVGTALQTLKLKRIGIIGAASESEEVYWRKQLVRYQVLDVFVPVLRDREHLAHLMVEELQLGIINQTTRADVGRIVYSLRQAGARAIVLVAPELTFSLSHLDPILPVLDATELHALAALDWSIAPVSPTHSSPARKLAREKRPRNHATTQA